MAQRENDCWLYLILPRAGRKRTFVRILRAALPLYATQLLNAGCRVTSIQRFLGHKELSSTMVYARAHDQTVAEDYFTAMARVEQRLEIVPAEPKDMEVVKVQEPEKLIQLIERLELPELCFEQRLDIACQMRAALAPLENYELNNLYASFAIGKLNADP